jgi:hypothetical protein
MIEELLHALWTHESTSENDRERLTQWASTNNVPLPSTTIKKAYDPVSKFGLIVKSWDDGGDDVHFEGWLSTPDRDLEKDETQPEAFIPAIDGYFQRRAPLSIVHQDKNVPIGHIRKAAIIRDGKVLKTGIHPTDPAEFEHLPLTGSGVWVRGVANEEPGRSAIRKGNVGGMSFIANASEKEYISGGRYRYTGFNHWIESTVAPYPINPSAVIAVAKAYGLTPPTKENSPMPKTLEEILNEALKPAAPVDENVVKAITPDQLKAVLEAQQKEHATAVEGMVADGVKKALDEMRLEGTGRQGTVLTPEQLREADPKAYIIKKAAETDPEQLSIEDKDLFYQITREALLFGMYD